MSCVGPLIVSMLWFSGSLEPECKGISNLCSEYICQYKVSIDFIYLYGKLREGDGNPEIQECGSLVL